ncbi:catecholate siderophore receptor Fiu [Pseudoxanthomonas indica]|uniref:Catecholate siderophore receptor n=1 Tax=Pseudoxanthomonas indica TaxID=428993 RepID=A0A1T5LLP7_9GAMM|nr:catecholate siderophore receptor Fiu [Pseudoxanthomonas indica]GGD36616.1 catecholate siderophore receptor Fiu [Pseudoxanthomonas indica]SKC76735.1 catecholate siderophore receptor [Pseudoxanthomonas indica]
MTPIKSRKHAAPNPRSTQGLVTATLLTGLTFAVPAAAQSTDAQAGSSTATTLPGLQVEGVRVDGYKADKVASPKFTQSLQDTPQTIQIITSDLFNQQGATNLTEALRNSPGVGTFFVGENGNTATGDTLYMRGFDSSSSIFVDGVRDLGSVSRDVFNIEQIEVEKGPAGTDNGRSAPTGAINLVSKQAFARNATSATISAGTDNQRRVTADWNQTLGTTSALRLNVMTQDSDVIGRDEVNNKRWGIAPSLAFGLGTETRYYLNLMYVEQDNVPDGGVPTIGLPGWSPQPTLEYLAGNPVNPENFYGTKFDHDDVTAQMATFRFEHDFSDQLKLTNVARWGKNEQDYLLTAFMITGQTSPTAVPTIQFTNPADLSTYTVSRSLPTFKDQEYTILTDQLNLRADFKTGSVEHNLSTGVEIAKEELKGWRYGTSGAWTRANLYNPDPATATGLNWFRTGAYTHAEATTSSVYAFDTVHLSESFLLTGGVRFDHYKIDYFSHLPCTANNSQPCRGAPVGTITDQRLKDSDTLFNWKLGAVYKLGDVTSFYANYAISQQPPGGSSLELALTATSANNPIYDPQKTETVEVGSKFSLLDDALLLAVALYQTDVSNEVITENGVTSQAGDKRVKGVEISAVGKITDAWSISAGYTTMDAKVTKGPAVAQDRTTDLGYTPDSAFTAWTTYELPFGLTFGGGVRYSGEMKRGTDGAVGTPTFVKSYTVWDAVVSYAFNKNVDLRLNGYNLFDKEYVAAINKSGYRYTPGAPRSVLLSLNLRF